MSSRIYILSILDVPDANASATFAGDITGASNTVQVRIQASGSDATLNLTGVVNARNSYFFITQGNVVLMGSGSIAGDEAVVGRGGGATHLTLRGNASFNIGGFSMGGGQALPSGAITILDNATLSTGAGSLDLLDTTTMSATTALSLSGGTTTVGAFIKSSAGTAQTSVIDFNGGTLRYGGPAASRQFPARPRGARPRSAGRRGPHRR